LALAAHWDNAIVPILRARSRQRHNESTTMKPHHLFVSGAVFIATLVLAPTAEAQLLGRWFGPKTAEKDPPVKSAKPDPRRVAEVNVEIAWLADPVTFPYYLEAHATANQLEVRGFVPNKTVREQALRIAQVYSSLPVVDSMKEHPSLLVRPSQMSPQQLQSSVQASLRVALPKQYQQLKSECGGDGKVFVIGSVNTLEEKLAVSHALRRLHGCTSVQNLTMLPGEKFERTPIVKTSNQKPVVATEEKNKPWWPFPKGQATTEEPPLLDVPPPINKGPIIVENRKPDGPILIPSLPEVKKEVVKVESPAPAPMSASELQKRIKAACPEAKNVAVQVSSAKEVQITVELANEKELNGVAERIFAMPELQNLRPELQFKINAP
jgi:hypothetical protein